MITYSFNTLECELDEIIDLHQQVEKSDAVVHDYGMITGRRIKLLLSEVSNSYHPNKASIQEKLLNVAEALSIEINQ